LLAVVFLHQTKLFEDSAPRCFSVIYSSSKPLSLVV
jgi:hypothetical protein